MSQFYLYRHIRTDLNVPFYIGIGKKQKQNPGTFATEYNRAFNFTNRSSYWNNIFDKCHSHIDVEVIYETDSREEIIEKEKEFIALYGRKDINKGVLVNLTDGGEGRENSYRRNYKHSPETREKLRLSHLGKTPSEETKLKMSLARKGKKVTESVREQMRLVQNRPEVIESKRKKMTGRVRTEEHKKRLSIALTGKKLSPEAIEKMRLTKIGRKHSEETRKKMSEARKGRIVSQETRKKLSESKKGKKRNPEKIRRGYKASEETKEKLRLGWIKRKAREAQNK